MASPGLWPPVPMVEKTWNLTRLTARSSAMPSSRSASPVLAWLTVAGWHLTFAAVQPGASGSPWKSSRTLISPGAGRVMARCT